MLPQNKPSYQASAPEAMDAEQLTATLDQLPVTRRHARLLGATGIGWALDAMDIRSGLLRHGRPHSPLGY